MAFKDDVKSGITEVLDATWAIREGQVVPETDDVTLRNGAVQVDAAYLYADLAASSDLAQKLDKEVAAKIIRAYISAASRILLNRGGAIRSFDGDRVMAVFIGGSKNTSAVRSALAINWAVWQVIWPKVKRRWPKITNYYSMDHGVGVATGEALIVRGGVRNNNDLISVGGAPNLAAKLSDLRSSKELYIDSAVYEGMNDSVIYEDEETKRADMWSRYGEMKLGGEKYSIYYSGHTWAP